MLESLLQLDKLQLNFSAEGQYSVNLILALIMFGVALEIKTEHFRMIFSNPKSYFIGIINQNFIIPFLTFSLVMALQDFISPSVALGMILVASCPGGNISNFMTNLAKGNTALSVSMTATTTLLAIVFTPFNFALWGGLYHRFSTSMNAQMLQRLTIDPYEMFYTVFILLGIPVIIGMIIAHYYPRFTSKIVQPIKTISIIMFMVIVVLAFANNYELFVKYIYFVFILVFIENAIAFAAGYGASRLFSLSEIDTRAITIESGIHNAGLGLVLLFNPAIFPQNLAIGGMFFVVGWWGIWHIVSGMAISLVWSKRSVEN